MAGGPDVVVAGTGQTDYTRRSRTTVRALAQVACAAALVDAGVPSTSVDGVVCVGGGLFPEDLIGSLGIRHDVYDALPAPGGNSAVMGLGLAVDLIRAGRASVVLVAFARNGASESRIAGRVGTLPGQQFRTQLEHPHGWSAPAEWYAMLCRRHMHEHGTTKDHLAAVALSARAHAQRNPAAMMHGRRMTRDDYDAAPPVAEPYGRLDCCLETDGAVALVVAASDAVDAARAVGLLAVEGARPESPDDLTNRRDWLRIGLTDAAPRAFARAGVESEDVDVALVYDCFTFEVLHQLEEAGLCERGAAGPLAAAGAFDLGGRLPVNPHGGLLSEGHLGGLNHVVEAVRQLRGEAGERQVDDARVAAVTGWGDWGDGSLALLAA